jgi:hypothetical protein
VILHGEQGLGDILFFLRFAGRLKAHGHPLAFWGDPRLQPLLARTGLFQHFLKPDSMPGPGIAVIWIGDLPQLLGANDPAAFDAPLAIPVDAARAARWRERLASWGPAPYVGLTWRAGIDRRGTVGLAKRLDPAAFGAALQGKAATWVSLQRKPVPDEVERLSGALGKPVHDAAHVNDDLDEALALLSVLDDYVGVSNTNTHLRAATGRAARVLVPWPPEWRWQERAEHSPWFPAMPLYRQAPDGDWSGALARLAADL